MKQLILVSIILWQGSLDLNEFKISRESSGDLIIERSILQVDGPNTWYIIDENSSDCGEIYKQAFLDTLKKLKELEHTISPSRR